MIKTKLSAGFGICALLLATTAAAQAPAPAPQPPLSTFANSGEIAALIAKAQQGTGPAIVQPVIGLAPYRANLEYRTGVSTASTHELDAELFYVLDGSGVVVIGGKLVGETRTNASNLRGDSVDGGTARPVAKGDIFLVPENTPHWFSQVGGRLVLISMHVPRPPGAPR
jgi:mannose-6-phosphate isomerase-like protein (cupin superfamily)